MLEMIIQTEISHLVLIFSILLVEFGNNTREVLLNGVLTRLNIKLDSLARSMLVVKSYFLWTPGNETN